MKTPRKLTRSAAAVALVVPLSVAALAAPAQAATASATSATLSDHYSPFPPGYGYGGYGGYPGYDTQTQTSAAQLDTADATTTEATGIVEIDTTIDYDEGEAAGTGLVLGSDGLVVTNHHVVEGATSITVTVPSTGKTYVAEVLGYDTRKDVALLQLEDASGLTTVTTDTGALASGDTVTAVGDAGGDGGSLTAAPGSVTDTSRTISVADDLTGQERKLRNLVEVTSDVVPGDSGGALLAADGDVVGMNVAASSGTTTDTVDGYAIAISRVLDVVARIESGDASGSVVIGGTPFLGVSLSTQDSSSALAGVVDGSPAQQLGLATGDTVTAVGGTWVDTADQLRVAIATHQPGDSVTVTWTDSAGATHSGTATLATGPIG
jgi:S1-C subfamily serine protease